MWPMGQATGRITSDSQADLGKVDPAVARHRAVPCPLDWNALDNHNDAGEEGDEDGAGEK